MNASLSDLPAYSADDVSCGLEELSQQLHILNGLANQERPAQRENWRRKLKEMRSEKEFVQQQLDKFNLGRRKQGREAREREELLARRNAVSLCA